MRQSAKLSGLSVCHFLLMSVLNAELSAERRDGNVGYNSPHYISSCARGRTPFLATQQGLGILSKRWPGAGPSDRGRTPVNGPYLTGVRGVAAEVHSTPLRCGIVRQP
jgi:hypothetical protein